METDLFRVLAEPNRRVLLERLRVQGPQPAGHLGRAMTISQPALSQHLTALRAAGLVSRERRGREQVYRLEAEPLRELARWVARYEHFWDEKLDALAAHLATTPTAQEP